MRRDDPVFCLERGDDVLRPLDVVEGRERTESHRPAPRVRREVVNEFEGDDDLGLVAAVEGREDLFLRLIVEALTVEGETGEEAVDSKQ